MCVWVCMLDIAYGICLDIPLWSALVIAGYPCKDTPVLTRILYLLNIIANDLLVTGSFLKFASMLLTAKPCDS